MPRKALEFQQYREKESLVKEGTEKKGRAVLWKKKRVRPAAPQPVAQPAAQEAAKPATQLAAAPAAVPPSAPSDAALRPLAQPETARPLVATGPY